MMLSIKTILLIVFITMPLVVSASQCWLPYIDKEIAKSTNKTELDIAVQRTSYIFIGEVLNSLKTTLYQKDKSPHLLKEVSEFNIIESIKGNISGQIVISDDSTCSCKHDFQPGHVYLVMAIKEDDIFETSACTYIKPIKNALVEEIKRSVMIQTQSVLKN